MIRRCDEDNPDFGRKSGEPPDAAGLDELELASHTRSTNSDNEYDQFREDRQRAVRAVVDKDKVMTTSFNSTRFKRNPASDGKMGNNVRTLMRYAVANQSTPRSTHPASPSLPKIHFRSIVHKSTSRWIFASRRWLSAAAVILVAIGIGWFAHKIRSP